MAGHLVLVGGGHAHMTVMKRLDEITGRGHRVTLVSPSRYQYYSGMGPGLLGGYFRPQETRFHVARMVEDREGGFIKDKVVSVDPTRKTLSLASGRTLQYDVASFNVGSKVYKTLKGGDFGDVYTVKPILNLLNGRQRIERLVREGRNHVRIVVVGGGPAGLEVAGNAWRALYLAGGRGEVSLVAGSRLLAGFPDRVRELAMTSLGRRGIDTLEGVHALSFEEDRLRLDNGRLLPFDVAFLAVGVRPPRFFAESGLRTGHDGGLLVNGHLQAVDHPDLFGGGDCVSLAGHDLAKVGVYAVRQNPILFHNLLARLEDRPLESFEPGGDYLLVFNTGDDRGIFTRGGLSFDGRAAFLLKNFLDRRFMRKFQVSGEHREPL